MKTFTVDASVIIKWVFPEKPKEEHVSQALNVLSAIQQGQIKIIQPPHWFLETIAVIARLEPTIASDAIELLTAMHFPILDTTEIYHLGTQLAKKYHHHLFDTLYHAVALHHGNSQLITADEKYYRKFAKVGAIIRLADFSLFE